MCHFISARKLYDKYILIPFYSANRKGCDSSVGIALGYGLDDRGSKVRFPARSGLN
jgi:hypothetical protein